jgi:hypothetical protein
MAWFSKKERFTDATASAILPLNSTAQATFDNKGENLIYDNASKYSRIMTAINPMTNPNFINNTTVNKFETGLQNATSMIALKGDRIVTKNNKDVLIPNIENTIMDTVRRCEAIKTAGCSAFDDPWFAANCGLCHSDGVNSQNDGHIGGLYNDPSTVPSIEYNARRAGIKYPNYEPSLGKCGTGAYSINKAQCERISRRLECEKKQNYEIAGCSQCTDDERFYYIPPGTAEAPIKLVVAGSGKLTYSSGGKSQSFSLNDSAKTITPEVPLKETDVLYLKVEKEGDNAPAIIGYIYAPTVTGEYRMDITRLADVDLETGSKPRFSGVRTMNNEVYNILRPAAGKTALNLQVYVPYTYIEPGEPEAQQCGSAPFLMNSTSATKLSSGPCFVKGAGPGRYSLDCIQQAFTAAGCTAAGSDYPKTLDDAQRIAGTKSIGVLADQFYNDANAANTGYNSTGVKLSLKDRHAIAQRCTGKSYLSPCDAYDTVKGPLGADCLNYLYKESSSQCTPNGLAAPIGADGKPNQTAIADAQKQGGVEAVKSYYASVYKRATDNGLKDNDRENAVKQCFGTGFVRDKQPVSQAASMALNSSLLTNPTANQKSQYARVNYGYPEGTKPVVVLGKYGMAPWGTSNVGFSDNNAEWIWSMQGAERDAPIYAEYDKPAFYYIYNNMTNSIINARVDFMIDNIGDLYVNNELIAMGHYGGWNGSWKPSSTYIGNQKSIQLKPGANLIKFVANNQGGPAGILIACFGPGEKLLFRSDGSWRWKENMNNILPNSVTDLDNHAVWTKQNAVVANLIDPSPISSGLKYWNPYATSEHKGPITYRLNFTFDRPIKLNTIVVHGFGDNAHDATAVRVYRDSTKTQLLGTYGSMVNRASAPITINPANTVVNNVYMEFDKASAWQLWLKRVHFYGE